MLKRRYLLCCLAFIFVFSSVLFAHAATQTINTLPSSNSTFITDLQTFLRGENADRARRGGWGVITGGIGATDASLTHTISAITAFPDGYYVYQAADSHTYTASKRTFVYVRKDSAVTVTITGATITYSTNLVFAEMAAATEQPATPAGCAPLFYADTDGTSITTVTDLRSGRVNLAYWDTLSAALTAIGTSNKITLIVSERYVVATSTDASTYTNITFDFITAQGMFSPSTGATLTLSPLSIHANQNQQIFTGSGTIAVTGTVNVRWWGAKGDYSNDDTAEIQSAVTASDDVFVPPGTYKLSSAITLDSGDTVRGIRGQSVLKQSANANIFEATGTAAAHKTDITITNLKMVGTQAAFTNFAIYLDYVSRLKVVDNDFQDINLIRTNASDTFADIDDDELCDDIEITGNVYDNNTLSANGGSLIFIRFGKHGIIAHNILKSKSGDQQSQAIEIYGGDGSPTSQGILANAAKSHNWTIANNVMQDMAAGIAVVQSHAVTVTGNVAHNCKEVYWSGGRSYDVTWIGNTDFEDTGSPIPFQTQGINGHTIVKGNTFRINTATGIPLWCGTTWESKDNSGPIIFEGNTVISGTTPTTCSFASVGHLMLKNNVFHDVRINTYENVNGIGWLDVEGNDFTYAKMGGSGAEATYMIRLNGICDNVFADVSGVSTSGVSPYARFARNTVKTITDYGTSRYIFYPNSWSGAGIFTIEGNKFQSPELTPRWELVLQQATDGIATTFDVRDNQFSARADVRYLSGNQATMSWRNNLDTYGRPYFNNVATIDHPWPEAGDAEPYWKSGTVLEGKAYLANNAATSWGVYASAVRMEIIASDSVAFGGIALLDPDTGGASATKLDGAATFVASTGALTGLSGVVGNVTVSAHADGAVYLENRSGGAKHFHFKITLINSD